MKKNLGKKMFGIVVALAVVLAGCVQMDVAARGGREGSGRRRHL